MRAIFSRSTAGFDSFNAPRHARVLRRNGVPTKKVPNILGELRRQHGKKGFALAEVRTDGSTVLAVLVKEGQRLPVVENI